MPAVAVLRCPQRIAGLLVPPPSAGIAQASPTLFADGSLLVIALQREALAQALSLPALAPRVLKLDPNLPLGYARDLDILPNTLPPERHVGYAVQWFGLAAAVFITALVLTWRSFLYTLFGIVVTTWLWASVAIFLKPIGMPVLTSTFVLVTWLMLIGAQGFKALIPVLPPDATTPEDERRRYLAGPGATAGPAQ